MEPQFYRPQRRRRDKEQDSSDYNEPLVPGSAPEQSSRITSNAERTVQNIDQALRDAEEQNFYTPNDTMSGSAGLSEAEGKVDDAVGRGYVPSDSKAKSGISLKGKGRFKRRLTLAIAAFVISLIGGMFAFLALLPLKVEHIVENLQSTFSATSQTALQNVVQKEFDKYVKNSILPSLASGKCRSTVDPSCVVVADGTGPVGKLYASWSQGRIENKLATDYGIVFAKNGPNYYMNLDGANIDLAKVRSGEVSIFDLPGTKQVTNKEIRAALNSGLEGATLWDKTYTRFKLGKYLETHFGVKRCVIKCSQRDDFSSNLANKKLAAEAYIIQRVITPASENYGLILQCIVGGSNFCSTALDSANPGDEERLSPFQKQLKAQLETFAAKYGKDSLDSLVKTAQSVSKDGFKKYVAKELAVKLAESLGAGDAAQATSAEAAEKAVPVIGWVMLIGQLAYIGSHADSTLRYFSYATNAAAAVGLYETYNTVASEMKSGNVDATELGSFTDALSSNLDGSSTDQVDAAQPPLYNQLLGDGSSTSTSFLDNISPGKASAAAFYPCDDGNPVPAGQLVCPEEELAQSNAAVSDVSHFMNSIPGLSGFGSIINWVSTRVNGVAGPVFQTTCNTVGWVIGCPKLVSFASSKASSVISSIATNVVKSPFSDNMNGGRTFDMLAAGADVANNESCQVELGCGRVTAATVNEQRNKQLADAKTEFNSMSLFARLFNTKTPYSLVSRIAMAMPTSFLSATNTSVASLLTNPLTKLGGAFANLFSTNVAFAGSLPAQDPFGVPQVGYSDGELQAIDDPETYWQQNCVNGPLAIYDDTTGQLDVSTWLNSQTRDPVSGQAVAGSPNPCLLIQSSVQSAGAIFNDSLIPSGSQNSGSSL